MNTNPKNRVRKYLAYQGMVRVVLIEGTQMVAQARNVHMLSNVVTAALGRTLLATTMMSMKLKEEKGRITVQIKGDGPIGSLVVCGDKKLRMKGYALESQVDLPLNANGKLDVAKAIGKGSLTVIKDIGLKDPYMGQSELLTSEVAEDFAYYFVTSEQTPCAVSLGVNIGVDNQVQMACGYIIEPLPECSEEVVSMLDKINSNISSVTSLMLDLKDMDDVARTITGDNQIQLLEECEASYQCDCNKERIENTIIALGQKDSLEILEENNGVLELTCNFCNKKYSFNKEEINHLFQKEK